MARSRRRSGRKRVGRVSYYEHHGAWYVYYQENGKSVRKRVADNELEAEQMAAQVNAQLSSGQRTLFSFEPVTVAELRRRFLDHHEHVLASSLATVRRYRAATQHLENSAGTNGDSLDAHQIAADRFVRYLRSLKTSPNGHPNTPRRSVRHKGIRFILEVCRSMYAFAARQRHLTPYAVNPFAELSLERMKVETINREVAVHRLRSDGRHAALHGPEQAQMSMRDVDKRSDVYSLGVLLYELLTGTTMIRGVIRSAIRQSVPNSLLWRGTRSSIGNDRLYNSFWQCESSVAARFPTAILNRDSHYSGVRSVSIHRMTGSMTRWSMFS